MNYIVTTIFIKENFKPIIKHDTRKFYKLFCNKEITILSAIERAYVSPARLFRSVHDDFSGHRVWL